MNEELLSFLWKQQRFRRENLCTTDGEPVQVIYPGLLNTDSGPDYLHARIRIGETLWVGNVELHARSSDWLKHGHQHDAAYAGIILHVVYEKDTELSLPCPELELAPFCETFSLHAYSQWQNSLEEIPCRNLLAARPESLSPLWMERLLVEKLETREDSIAELLRECCGDWEGAFFIWLARFFGMRVNADPFEQLARSIPWSLFRKMLGNAAKTEALLFGQAGFLEEGAADGYQHALQAEYRYLKQVYHLSPLPVERWKFMRLRPANFPGLRISQFADLWVNQPNLLNALIHSAEIKSMESLMECRGTTYWESHTRFGQSCRPRGSSLGEESRNLLLANAVLPFLFVYAREQSLPDLRERIPDLFHELKAEDNRIIRKWKEMRVVPRDLGESQALIHLNKHYCQEKKCLSCQAGAVLLKGCDETIKELTR